MDQPSILCDFSLKISMNIKAEKVAITLRFVGLLCVPVWWENNRLRDFRILVNKGMKGWCGWWGAKLDRRDLVGRGTKGSKI